MDLKRLATVLGLTVVVFAVTPSDAFAWGPATHVKLANDLLCQLSLLPAGLAALLSRHARDYIFGNLAADVVLAKKLSRVKQFCHHWETGFTLLEQSRTDVGRAFAWGYLSHLSADTVAHNKFLPRQMTVTRTTMSFGHVYWEMRADATIGPHYWKQLRNILDEVFDEHHDSLSERLTDTFLPFSINWRLFRKMHRFASRRDLRGAMDRLYAMSRWPLSDQLMREYRAECLERTIDVVTHGQASDVLHEDPNGNAALAYTRAHRRQLRQMARSGLIAPHILYEAEITHAPAGGSAVSGTRHRRAFA